MVLIIGILAAVALPQYDKAVRKAKAMEALSVLPSLGNAYYVYYLTTGELTNDLSLFDVTIPGNRTTKWWAQGNSSDPNNYYFSCADINNAGSDGQGGRDISCVANAANPDLPFFQVVKGVKNGLTCSIALGKTAKAQKICESLSSSKIPHMGYYDL